MRDNKAQTEILSNTLLFTVFLVFVSVIFAALSPFFLTTLDDINEELALENSKKISYSITKIVTDKQQKTSVRLVGDTTLTANSSAADLSIDVGSDTVVDRDIGRIYYEGANQSTILYEGGGLWSYTEQGNYYNHHGLRIERESSTLSMTYIDIEKNEKGDLSTITFEEEDTKFVLEQDLSNENIIINVNSEDSSAWGEYISNNIKNVSTTTTGDQTEIEIKNNGSIDTVNIMIKQVS